MCSFHDTWVDLASRDNDGLEITLLWNESSGRVKVAVADSRLGDEFELDVARADALGAFYHPFAYAARHDHDGALPVDPQLQAQL
jgi:hypothetical protein